MEKHFCTVCGREVRETPSEGPGHSVRFDCSCGAEHIVLVSSHGKTYLARVLPVHRMPEGDSTMTSLGTTRATSRNGALETILTGLVEDEDWQGNLTTDERRQCLTFAERRLDEALKREKANVRGLLSTLNHLLECEPINRADVIRAMLGA